MEFAALEAAAGQAWCQAEARTSLLCLAYVETLNVQLTTGLQSMGVLLRDLPNSRHSDLPFRRVGVPFV